MPDAAAMIERALSGLLGLQLFKSWNIFATRIFYFVAPESKHQTDEGDYRLTLDCPWRIEQDDRILVGFDDYRLPSEDNHDPNWNATDMQWGHLQDQLLVKMLGETNAGEIFNTGSQLVVDSVSSDVLGGFQLRLTGGYFLTVFPACSTDMQWMLTRLGGGSISLMNAIVQESDPPS